MNRISIGILGAVIFINLLAGPASREGVRGASPDLRGGMQGADTASAVHSALRKIPENCVVKPNTFESDLIDAVRLEYSRGRMGDDGCPEKYQIPEKYRLDDERNFRTQVLFALVPDPVHTNLSLLFDQQMDAVQQGVLDSGWTFEKALMPWDNKTHPESSDFRIRLLQEQFEDEQESRPGLMLFRRSQILKNEPEDDKWNEESRTAAAADLNGTAKNSNEAQEKTIADSHGGPKQRLLVFVIAESPAGGIHKRQFLHALDLVQQLFLGRPRQANQPLPDIAIAGPTFSGSLHSLAALLDCKGVPAYPCNKVRIRSGTVTSQSAKLAFQRESGLPVVSLQENDDYVVRQFLYFACKTWRYQPHEIAILSEDETAYGSAGMTVTRGGNEREIDSCGDRLDDHNERETLHLYFPRDISQLRSAYQRVAGANNTGKSNVPRTTLPLDLDSNSTDEDTVREYSGKQLPLSQEAVMLGIVGELEAHRSQIVLLRATSALDQLFLSRYLRQAYPGARIITVSADLLFAREIEDARLHGVMALTTYSLTPAADHEFHNDAQIHSDRVFPNTHAVGTYNAVKLLMAIGKLGQEECTSDPKDRECVRLFQYEWPTLSRGADPSIRVGHPPVHLTVLGHGGFWDVAVLPETAQAAVQQGQEQNEEGIARSSLPVVEDPKDRLRNGDSPDRQSSEAKSSNDERLEEQQPQIWYVLWILAIGVSLAYAYIIWFPSILSSSQSVAQLAPPLPDSRRNLLALTALLHFSLLLAVFWPYWYLFKNAGRRLEIAGLLLAITSVAITSSADLWRRECIRQRNILIASFALMPLVLVIAWQPDYFHYMSVFRSIHLASGVSELLSVLLLLCAGLWGAWYALSGSSLVDVRRTILPAFNIASSSLPEPKRQRLKRMRSILEEGQRQLRTLLDASYIDKRALALGCFLAFPILIYTWGRPLRTLEPINHEYVLTALTLFLFLALVVEVFRIRGIWTELRHLLTALDSVPLRIAFQKLDGFTWSPLWQMGGGNLGDFQRLISRQLEALRCAFALKTPILQSIETRFNNQLQNTLCSFERLTDTASRPQFEQQGSHLQTTPEQSETAAMAHVGSPSTSEAAAAVAPARSMTRPIGPPKASVFDWVKCRLFPETVEREIALLKEFELLQREFSIAGLYGLAFVADEWDASTQSPEEGAPSTSKPHGKSSGQPETQVTRAFGAKESAELFLALLYTNFIAIVLTRIRTLIIAVGGVYVFFVLALTTYPFQPQLEIRFFLAVLLLFIIGVVGVVYAQMHRDATLSHITNTEPGELGSSFWLRIGSFVALPVFSLIASGYPEIGNTIYSWLEPALHALQ